MSSAKKKLSTIVQRGLDPILDLGLPKYSDEQAMTFIGMAIGQLCYTLGGSKRARKLLKEIVDDDGLWGFVTLGMQAGIDAGLTIDKKTKARR